MATTVADMPIEVAHGELVTRYQEFGEMAIRHASLPAGTDMAPVLQGLPGDRCPSPHWGIVLSGSIVMRHADGTEETARAGTDLPLAGRPHRSQRGRRGLPRGWPGRADATVRRARAAAVRLAPPA